MRIRGERWHGWDRDPRGAVYPDRPGLPVSPRGPVTGIVLALFASIGWGTSTAAAGRASRNVPPLWVAIITEWTGLVVVIGVLVVLRPEVPPWSDLGLSMLGGISGGIGLVVFYRALSMGTMGLVAPIAAFGAAMPVIIGVARGERPSALAFAGVVVALTGGIAVARAPGRATRQGIGLAALAAVCFGGYFTLIDLGAEHNAIWASGFSRTAAGVVLVAIALVVRNRLPGDTTRAWLMIAPIGLIDATASLLYAVATTKGLVSLVAVTASLYPLTTAALAYMFLGERLGRFQVIGAGLAMAGIAMVVAGG